MTTAATIIDRIWRALRARRTDRRLAEAGIPTAAEFYAAQTQNRSH